VTSVIVSPSEEEPRGGSDPSGDRLPVHRHSGYLARAVGGDRSERVARRAAAVLGDDQNPPQPHDSATPVQAKIQQFLGNASIIPIRFGRSADEGSVGIRTWTEKLTADGLL
jgi:hypothetical protein